MRKTVDPDATVLVKLGTLLDRHIRWEERQLFNRLQETLTPRQLAHLQQQSDLLEKRRARHVGQRK